MSNYHLSMLKFPNNGISKIRPYSGLYLSREPYEKSNRCASHIAIIDFEFWSAWVDRYPIRTATQRYRDRRRSFGSVLGSTQAIENKHNTPTRTCKVIFQLHRWADDTCDAHNSTPLIGNVNLAKLLIEDIYPYKGPANDRVAHPFG